MATRRWLFIVPVRGGQPFPADKAENNVEGFATSSCIEGPHECLISSLLIDVQHPAPLMADSHLLSPRVPLEGYMRDGMGC